MRFLQVRQWIISWKHSIASPVASSIVYVVHALLSKRLAYSGLVFRVSVDAFGENGGGYREGSEFTAFREGAGGGGDCVCSGRSDATFCADKLGARSKVAGWGDFAWGV